VTFGSRSGTWSGVAEKLLAWVIFSVIIGLLPMAFDYFQLSGRNLAPEGLVPAIRAVTADGELCLVAVGLSAAAIGELLITPIAEPQPFVVRVVKMVAIGGCIIIIYLASSMFADASLVDLVEERNMQLTNTEALLPDPKKISARSIAFFVYAIVASASCIIIAEVQKLRPR
jgi:hypothetical protein